jgi:hypothetical protein
MGDDTVEGNEAPTEPIAIEEQPADNDAMAAAADVGPALEAADVDLALRYLAEFAVVVLADRADPEMVRVVAAAAGWADARLIAVVPAGGEEPAGLPPDAIVVEAPDADPDGVFAAMVGSFAAALDDGDEPAEAFRATLESRGWTQAHAE